MANVTIINGANVGRSFELSDRELVVGREPTCEIVMPVRTVSRRHARFGRDSGGYYVEDLGSVNGTFINGQPLSGRIRLEHQDRVRISQNVFQFFDNVGEGQTVMLDRAALADPASAALAAKEPGAKPDEPSRQRIVSSVDVAREGQADINPQAKLRAVLEITKSLGSSLELNDVLPRLLDSLFRIFPQTEHGYVLQAPRVGAQLEPIAIKHRQSDSDTISPLGGPIVARVMTEAVAFLSSPDDDDDSVLDAGPVS
ncbi:MAG: FHA domain-containing protein, partial [Planctomycetales bacterium]|nr:FHA domain-containing protein [Planctomycetales bacterium]